MKLLKVAGVFAIITALVMVALPNNSANAATTTTSLTVTQDEINASTWVKTPRNKAISNVQVTIEQDDIRITSTVTPKAKNASPIDTISVWKPVIRGGWVYWQLTSMTANGKNVTGATRIALMYAHRIALSDTVLIDVRKAIVGAARITKVTLTPGTVTLDLRIFGRLRTVKSQATPAATAQAQ
jgi:hypothetical protein